MPLRKQLGWILLLVLSLPPVLRWFFLLSLNIRFFDFGMTMTSLGQLTGLLGMSLFSLNLILSGRFKFLDSWFFGLNQAYNWHRIVGALSFSLLLFHPLFLAIKYLSLSTRAAALFLLPFTGDPAVTYGIISLALMIVLMAITFYARIKYQNWKLTHKFMVAVFIFALLHAWFISSDISRDSFLRYYIFTLAFVGLASGFCRAWLSRFFNADYLYEVKELNWPNSGVVDIRLEAKKGSLNFRSGQFIFLRFLNSRVSGESHPFSLSSSPAAADLNLTIKSLGDFTSGLKDLRIGDLAAIEGPFGKFSFAEAGPEQIWLAGGVGITPFLSMARDPKSRHYHIDLYYAVKDKSEAVFLDELMAISRENKNLRVIPWYSSVRGRLSAEAIAQTGGNIKTKDIFLCGPAPFMKSLIGQLRKTGVKKSRLYREEFNFI